MIERTRELHRTVQVPAPISEVFEFFSRAENLDRITPPWLRFRLQSSPPHLMHSGTRIDYSLKLNGIRFLWRSEVTFWDPPHAFEDTQIKGPYTLWVHRHTFRQDSGGTAMTDHVRYAVPGAYFEPLIHSLFVRPRLEAIFDYREETLLRIFARDQD